MDVKENTPEPSANEKVHAINQTKILEVIFVALLILVLVAAIFEAWTYSFVAARPPLIILGVALLLVIIQARRLRKGIVGVLIGEELKKSLQKKDSVVRKVAAITGCMLALVAAMVVAGQHIAVGLFIFILMYYVSKESFKLSFNVALGTIAVIFLLFEWVLDIELYRGIVYLLLNGYKVF